MPAWATVVLTLGVSAIAVAGTLGATWLQHRFATRQRREAEWVGLRDRGAQVFGPIEILLADTDPNRFVADRAERNLDWRHEIEARWQAIRNELAIYANAHSVAEVGIAARRLSDAVGKAVTSSLTAALESPSQATLETAEKHRERARALLEVTVAATRNDIPPHAAAVKAAEIDGERRHEPLEGLRRLGDADPKRLR